ncbi:alpha/beta hydrolase [Microbacterium sp. M1A1_1b]
MSRSGRPALVVGRPGPPARAAAVGVALAAATFALTATALVARRAAAVHEPPAPAPQPDAGLRGVHVHDVDGHELQGWVAPSVGDGSRWALALPGLGSHPLRHQEIAPRLAVLGYTCLFAAHSAHWPTRRHRFGVRETDEARAWLRYAAEHGAQQVVLLGWSFGAFLWLRALASDDPLPVTVRAVVLTGPLTDWVPTIAHGVGGGVLGRSLGRAVSVVLAVPGLSRLAGQAAPLQLRRPVVTGHAMPLLVVHSDADRTVPLATSRALVAAWTGPARLRIVHGARHGAERDVAPNGWLDDVSTTV